MSQQPSRRDLLKITAAAIASLILPKSLFARNPDHSFFFLHADTGNFWPVADPVACSLENAHHPVLERAAEGLGKLTPSDGDRIIRLAELLERLLEVLPLVQERVREGCWSLDRGEP